MFFHSSENKRRTKHISRTLNPEWNEEVRFTDVHKEELRNKTLEVTVWDYDRFKANDFLGEVVLDLSGKGIYFFTGDKMLNEYKLKVFADDTFIL